MAILNEYNQIIREYFDISDTKTRQFIVNLEDADQTQLLAALSSALYDKIVKKVDKIDFGTIPNSRGDITKVEGFESTMECLSIIRRLVIEYKENPEMVDTVITAVENVKSRKALFMKGYSLNIEFPMVMYNLVVLAIEQCVSFLIAVCIQYIKDPASQTMSAALDKVAYKNTRDNMLFEQLIGFNNSCKDKEFDSVIEDIIKNAKPVRESANEVEDSTGGVNNIIINVGKQSVAAHPSPFLKFDDDHDCEKHTCPECGNDPCSCPTAAEPQETQPTMEPCTEPERVPVNGAKEVDNEDELQTTNESPAILIPAVAAVAPFVVYWGGKAISMTMKGLRYLIKGIIPMLRNITYFCINTRVKFSDTLAVQAQLIEANAYKLQYSSTDMDDAKKKKVIDKQLKWAERLKKWSNRFAIDNKKAEKEAKKMITDDEKDKAKIEDGNNSTDNGGLFAR